jgi:hypothetical protein
MSAQHLTASSCHQAVHSGGFHHSLCAAEAAGTIQKPAPALQLLRIQDNT